MSEAATPAVIVLPPEGDPAGDVAAIEAAGEAQVAAIEAAGEADAATIEAAGEARVAEIEAAQPSADMQRELSECREMASRAIQSQISLSDAIGAVTLAQAEQGEAIRSILSRLGPEQEPNPTNPEPPEGDPEPAAPVEPEQAPEPEPPAPKRRAHRWI